MTDEKDLIGRKITGIGGNEDCVWINFDGYDDRHNRKEITLKIWDGGQSCCEHRYMNVQDDLDYYVGSTYLGWDLGDCDNVDHEYDVHEIQFLNIKTSLGDISISNHNEHNGYYGGFYIQSSVI